MNAFILLPKEVYLTIDTVKFEKVFRQNLDKYFYDYDLAIYGKSTLTTSQVIFMDDVKDNYSVEMVVDTVEKLFKACFKSETIKVDVKVNYKKLNPNFMPTDEEKNVTSNTNESIDEYDYERLSKNYFAIEPRYSFSQVVLSQRIIDEIDNAIGVINVEHKVFDEWGLREIIPEVATALNFYGPPGTGKTMAAEAVAKKLGKKIIKATYADIESKYHGEGPKMVKAIFRAAEREDAILFLDEADSLLSKRLTNVTDGSAQAINSMRSQLLISLENHKGLVIFASNLVVNYDKAFLSRLINIEFVYPNKEEREKIWQNHLKGHNIRIPLSEDVDISFLAEKYDFCGREIKNSIKDACVRAAMKGNEYVTLEDFIYACDKLTSEKIRVLQSKDYTNIETTKVSNENKTIINELIKRQLEKKSE